jgi:histidyl-tRNA synthetase
MRHIYHYKHKRDRDLALRPEVTPSLVRMVSARQGQIQFPAKWWTIAQCFRYERMTRGRKREHFQWNVDVMGEKSVMAEAWVLSAACRALRLLGLGPDDVKVHINNRQLVAHILTELGVPEPQHLDAFMILDKKGKVPPESLKEMLVEKGVAAATADAVLTHMGEVKIEDLAAGKQVTDLLDAADVLGFRDYLVFDSGIVRGLSYYTGTVFEAFDAAQNFRAIFGGGRYDNLFESVTGQQRAAVGFGFGDVVIAEILAEREGGATAKPTVQVCVGAFDASLIQASAEVAGKLLAANIQTDLAFGTGKPGKFFQYADRRGARFTVFLAPTEYAQAAVMVKEMASAAQSIVPIAELPAWLTARL